MTQEHLTIVMHLLAALTAGALIGSERSFHGRPAGFRTHSLVCIASALLMFLTLYQGEWVPSLPAEALRTDPMRMAQGIMTGIGFLGAGVIIKEGLSVRGLTTAASIWITAAIGILAGAGLYFAVAAATLLTLGVLALFRWVESMMPMQYYAHHAVRFGRDNVMPETELRATIARHGFTIANLTYRLEDEGSMFEYRMVIRSLDKQNGQRLAETWLRTPSIREFRISPTGD